MINKLSRIIIHWSAGLWYPNDYEKQFYHFLIDCDGKCYSGNHKPEDNIDCTDGNYAAHTGGGNTGSIGVALCAMLGFISPANAGKYPITKPQLEACFKFCAELCEKYKIPVENVMTHYEFGKAHPQTTSAGKIDIIFLPPYPEVKQNEIGDFIRQKIKWYLNRVES